MPFAKKNLWFILLGISLAVTTFFITSSRSKNSKQDASQKKEVIDVLPEITSCVQSIKVVKARIKNAKSSDAMVVIEVENKSDIGVVAISIESKSKQNHEGYRIITNSFGSENPIILIEPHHTNEFTMEVANIRPDGVVEIGGIVFADGTEEGCEGSLKGIRETKSLQEAKAKASKEPR